MRQDIFPDLILKPVFAVVLAFAVALGVSAPQRATAQDGIAAAVALGIVGTAVYCAANPHKCGGGQTATTGGARVGAVDAIALNRTQAMWVQGGLRNLGFYTGAIDGAIGAGTRSSIRQYQAAIGANATGRLTGQQINDLVALSPDFMPYADDAPYLFNADLANDLSRDQVRQLQAELNRRGFSAGPVDGAFGGMTRNAIAAYKASQGLPGGPVASRRLLAQMLGAPAPVPAGAHLIAWRPSGSSGSSVGTGGANTAENVVQPQADAPAAAPVAPAGGDLVFDLLGVTLGMKPDAVMDRLAQEFGASLVTEQADAAGFGGAEALDIAYLGQQPDWPADATEQFVALFDSARPELGAVAAFRMIRMPPSVDQAMFDAQVMPEILAKYGADAQFGDIWIGGADARAAAREDAGVVSQCGQLRVADVGTGSWAEGTGPLLDTASLSSVARDCGQVLSVSFEASVIRIGLWDSAAMSGAAAPKIKF